METYSSFCARNRHAPRLSAETARAEGVLHTELVKGGEFDVSTDGLKDHMVCIPMVPGTRLITRAPGFLNDLVLSVDHVTFLPAETRVRWTAIAPKRVRTLNFLICPSLVSEVSNSKGLGHRTGFIGESPMLREIGLILHQELSSGNGSNLVADAAARAMALRLARISAGFQDVMAVQLSKREVSVVLDMIEASHGVGISLSTIACAVNISPRHLNRLLVESVGKPLHKLAIEARARWAKQLLSETDDTIDSVAKKTGHYDASHLRRQLKLINGPSLR